jgi:2-haloalkanoic acid dehalogenase type II
MARTQGLKDRLAANVEYTAEQALTDTLARWGVCFIPDAVLPSAIAKFFEFEALHWVPYPDASETLERLKRSGLKLALLSNATDQAFIEKIAQASGIAEFLDPLLTSAAIGFRKPDPRAFQPILEQWQLPPHQVAMVGDVPSFDILGAHRTGMRAVLIGNRWDEPLKPHGEFEDAEQMEPDAVIRNLAELPTCLSELDAA